MKNSKKLLTSTLGLMLGVGLLVGCGEAKTYTVSFKEGNELLHTETVKAGEYCPDYVPEVREGYTFKGWYKTRQHAEVDKVDLASTPINSDITFYAWYKEDFIPSTDKFYVVGNIFGADHWDGEPGAPETQWADRALTLNEAELANEKNVFEIDLTVATGGTKFRIIKAVAGEDGTYASAGWTNDYSYTQVTSVTDPYGNDIKADAIADAGDNDSHNIIVNQAGKFHLSLTIIGPDRMIDIHYTELGEAAKFESIGLVGTINGWGSTLDLALTPNADNTVFTRTVALPAGAQFKLRQNNKWSGELSYGNITSEIPEGIVVLEQDENGGYPDGGNIKTDKAGNYTFTVEGAVEGAQLNATAFTITYAAGPAMVDYIPQADVSYKWGIEQTDGDYFFIGSMDPSKDRFAQTSTDISAACDVTLVAVEGGWNLTYKSGDVTKYLNVVKVGTYDNLQSQDTAVSVWTWDATYNTLVTELDGKTFYCGTYGTYTTIGASDYDVYAAKDGQIHSHLYLA